MLDVRLYGLNGWQEYAMNCDWVQQNITLYLYNELADDAHHEVEQHIARCPSCAAELAAAAAIPKRHERASGGGSVAQFPGRGAHEAAGIAGAGAAAPRRGITGSPSILRHGCGRYASRPRWPSVIFMVGFGGGIGAMYQAMSGKTPAATPTIATRLQNLPSAASPPFSAIPIPIRSKFSTTSVMPESVEGTVDRSQDSGPAAVCRQEQ